MNWKKIEDWDRLEEGLRDSLWTNNVVKYMEQYAVYKQLQKALTNNKEQEKCILNLTGLDIGL